jgi:hypothetical protein
MEKPFQAMEPTKPLNVFCCYAHTDQHFFLALKTHLRPLERRGLITLLADVGIEAGVAWEKALHLYLDTAPLLLLLVSPDFLASEYCYTVEMQRARARATGRSSRYPDHCPCLFLATDPCRHAASAAKGRSTHRHLARPG